MPMTHSLAKVFAAGVSASEGNQTTAESFFAANFGKHCEGPVEGGVSTTMLVEPLLIS